MEDSKDKVQENLLANGGRCRERGYVNALMLPVFASEYGHSELKHSPIRQNNPQEYFLRAHLATLHFFPEVMETLYSSSFASGTTFGVWHCFLEEHLLQSLCSVSCGFLTSQVDAGGNNSTTREL